MDTQLTVRQMKLTHWAGIISQCRSQCQSDGIEVRQWLRDNNINRDQYYYWYKKVKEASLAQQGEPAFLELKVPGAAPAPHVSASHAGVAVSIGNFTISVPDGTSRDTLRLVLEEVSRVK